MRKHGTTIFLIMILLIGLSLMLYPSVSNWWNSFHQSRAIAAYSQQVSQLDNNRYADMWDAARNYNRSLVGRENAFVLDDVQKAQYDQLLDVSGMGIMGYIEIPTLKVTLPIYHGTDDAVLQVAVGHLEWTSLPVGGESTHCVLSGHRGLPSARLFTDLDKLVVGDRFLLGVLDQVLTYEVDQILIVEPQDTDALHIEEGEDLCTLVTCTPYGINSHRLLVRGHRVETEKDARNVRVTSDAIQIEPYLVAPIVAAPVLLVLFIGLLIPKRRKK